MYNSAIKRGLKCTLCERNALQAVVETPTLMLYAWWKRALWRGRNAQIGVIETYEMNKQLANYTEASWYSLEYIITITFVNTLLRS